MIYQLVRKARQKGFVGPYYKGIKGTARFIVESTVVRNEFIFAATPQSVAKVTRPPDPGLTLHMIEEYAGIEPYKEELERAYYRNYTHRWKAPFSWGERLVIGTVNGRTACFNWMQEGTSDGFPTYYGRLFAGEARVLRAGVLPEFRRCGVNACVKYLLLQNFFASGVTRVYSECYQFNIPSARTFLRTGFTPIGLITLIEAWPLRRYVRWQARPQMMKALKRIGLVSA